MVAADLCDDSIRKIYHDAVGCFESGIFVELGCLCGASTVYLAQEIKQQKRDIVLYAVDLWLDSKESFFPLFWNTVIQHGCEDIIRPIMADSARASRLFVDKSVTFVFIDANHDYDPVTRDILYWLPKLKDKSWIAGHDFDYHVFRSVRRLFGDRAVQVLNNSWLVKLEIAT